MKRLTVLAAFALAILALFAPRQSSAEWFGDLYGGAAFTQKHDVEIDSSVAKATAQDVKFDTAGLIGGRAMYWFESFSFLGTEPGAGLDISHLFGPDVGHQTPTTRACVGSVCVTGPAPLDKVKVDVTVFGFDAMLRYPLLKSDKFPRGQLQPYLTLGPALFVAHAKVSPSDESDTDTRVGVKVGVGLRWQFDKIIAVFGEYRFTHFDPTVHFNDAIVGRTQLSTNVNTHAILGGLSIRFP